MEVGEEISEIWEFKIWMEVGEEILPQQSGGSRCQRPLAALPGVNSSLNDLNSIKQVIKTVLWCDWNEKELRKSGYITPGQKLGGASL